ncbi:MAG: ABC transporter substrate-binding protein/permease, partial [Deltaproteobacteria bacterium]|nr:ABC transporter substrate-binding protein/permease [Deltaproteobacteria bacterium]
MPCQKVMMVALLLLPLLHLGACREQEGPRWRQIKKRGVLRWGGDMQGGEPYVFEDPDRPGHLVGFEVDLAEAIAKRLGLRAEFVQNDWSTLVPALERGSFDIILNGFEITEARAEQLRFTRPYYVFSLLLVTRKSDPWAKGLEALRGKRIGALTNSLAWERLLGRGFQPIPYEGSDEPYLDLRKGRIDGVLFDDIVAHRYGLVYEDLHAVERVGDGHYAIACRKSDVELCEAIDRALAALISEGVLREILKKWKLDNERQESLEAWDFLQTEAKKQARRFFEWSHFVAFLQASGVTVLISTLAMAVAIVLGLGLCLARLYGPFWLQLAASAYIEIWRGTPVLLQLYVLYFGLMPAMRSALGTEAGVEYDPWIAGVLGLGLNYAAYEAEIYRGAIQAIPKGQMEAALVLGMSTSLAL